MSDVSLELEPIARPVPRTTSTLSEFAGDDTFHDMMDSERRKADMTSIHRPVDLMTFEEADKAEGLVVAGSREYDPSGHEAASGVSSTRQKMSDEAFAWKLWEEENKSIRREQRNASGRYHAEDELLARALQEEYDQEGEHKSASVLCGITGKFVIYTYIICVYVPVCPCLSVNLPWLYL
jgi:hypothetical protein